MSVSLPTSCALGVSITPDDGPLYPSRTAAAISSFYEEVGIRPTSMTVFRARSSDPRFSEKALRRAMEDSETRAVWLWCEENDGVPELRTYLRPADPANQEFEQKFVTLVSHRIEASPTSALHRLLASFLHLYPVVHGAVGRYRSTNHAAQECCFSGIFSSGDPDAAFRERLKHDQLHYNRSKSLLRRLYPVTIIGPELWAKLPPMPSLARPPLIEDIGDCKMLTCWPELVEPHDPKFLAGTEELRRWIWPYTIQNPADDPDAIARWLGL